MSDEVHGLISVVSLIAWLTYIFAGALGKIAKAFGGSNRRFATIVHITKWPALAGALWVFGTNLAASHEISERIWSSLTTAAAVWTWWLYSKDGDDDWKKKLKKKLASKVTQIGGRLAVVPT